MGSERILSSHSRSASITYRRRAGRKTMDATDSAKSSNDDVVKVFSFFALISCCLYASAFFFSFHGNQEEICFFFKACIYLCNNRAFHDNQKIELNMLSWDFFIKKLLYTCAII